MAYPTRPPFALAGIDHVLLLVSGMQDAARFYSEVLGCECEGALPEFAMVQFRAGGALIDLVDVSADAGKWALPRIAGGRNMDHLCIALDGCDEDALRGHLANHGVEVIEEGFHKGARGDSLSLYVKDPSGNTIELKGPPPDAR
jgi:catechol 2,3-dioxygenase-like lactoylglutathione lyase family enzyme